MVLPVDDRQAGYEPHPTVRNDEACRQRRTAGIWYLNAGGQIIHDESPFLANSHGEAEFARIITDNIDRKSHCILAWHNSVKVNQRGSSLHCQAQADVVSVHRIFATISIAENPLVAYLVIIETRFSLNNWRGPYGERNFRKDGGLKDSVIVYRPYLPCEI